MSLCLDAPLVPDSRTVEGTLALIWGRLTEMLMHQTLQVVQVFKLNVTVLFIQVWKRPTVAQSQTWVVGRMRPQILVNVVENSAI